MQLMRATNAINGKEKEGERKHSRCSLCEEMRIVGGINPEAPKGR